MKQSPHGGRRGLVLSHETGPLRRLIGAEVRNLPESKDPPSWKKTPPVSCWARDPLKTQVFPWS